MAKPISGLKVRSQQTKWHHLFKAKVALMKKDLTAYLRGKPTIKDVEHCHFFHSINSFGQDQTHTNEVGGHFHEVKWSLDETGTPKAKCGPALRKITKKGRNGDRKSIVPVRFQQLTDDDTEASVVIDDHIHDMQYEGSDELSTAKVQQIQAENTKRIEAMKPKPPADFDVKDSDGARDL